MQYRERQKNAELNNMKLVEIDSWLVLLADLISQMSGIDPEKSQITQQEAIEKLSQATDRALVADQALPIFDQAIDKFKESIAVNYNQWSMVQVNIAKKHIQDLANKNLDQAKVRERDVKADVLL